MRFEVLVEDQSGSIALEYLLEKILGENGSVHYWNIHSFKGLGLLPKYLNRPPDPKNWLLLEQLPRLLQGYGRSLPDFSVVLVVVDSDDKDCIAFKQDLFETQSMCDPQPKALFRIAIEEIESWLLGDPLAVKLAYPDADEAVLNSYIQDSVCGTWEVLADAVDRRGSSRLRRANYQEIGKTKRRWAEQIAPQMDVNRNKSKSFQVFRDGIRNLAM